MPKEEGAKNKNYKVDSFLGSLPYYNEVIRQRGFCDFLCAFATLRFFFLHFARTLKNQRLIT